MPRTWLMVLVFFVAIVVFAIVTMPAAFVLGEQQRLNFDGEAVTISNVRGKLLNGRADISWQNETGRVSWQLKPALLPSVNVDLASELLDANGIISGFSANDVRLKNMKVRADVSKISDHLALDVGGATGSVDGAISYARLTKRGLSAEGQLDYSGGNIFWTDGDADVGSLVFDVTSPEDNKTEAVLHEQNSSKSLMEGIVHNREFEWSVLRRWVHLLGMSKGGSQDDVVFKVSDEW